MPALVIATDGDVKQTSVPESQSDHLAWMYEQISCTMVDVVGLPHDLDLWIDEDGIDKPVNIIATLWARYFGGLDVILHGDVILAKHDGKGNTVDMSDKEAIAFMLTMLKVVDMAADAIGDAPGVIVTEISPN